MSILVCGSIAYDTLFSFEDRFDNHILPDQLHKISTTFKVPSMRREFGGCGGNIAYNLALLGERPIVMAAVERISNPTACICAGWAWTTGSSALCGESSPRSALVSPTGTATS